MTIQRKDLANEFGNKEKFQLLIRLVGKIKQACTWTQKGQITRVRKTCYTKHFFGHATLSW